MKGEKNEKGNPTNRIKKHQPTNHQFVIDVLRRLRFI